MLYLTPSQYPNCNLLTEFIVTNVFSLSKPKSCYNAGMRIAILGGSFDPPHIGHLLVAQQVKKLLNVDQVWLMPAFTHPFNKPLTNATHRLAMAKLLQDSAVKVSDFEIAKKGTSFTIDTLTALKKEYPQDSFFWIIGSDQVTDFPKWKNWEEIINKYHLIIYSRNEPHALEEKIKTMLALAAVPNTIHILNTTDLLTSDASSRSIRKRAKDGLSLKGLVPKAVETYIMEHKLYA